MATTYPRYRRRGYLQGAAFVALIPFSAAAFWFLSGTIPAHAPAAQNPEMTREETFKMISERLAEVIEPAPPIAELAPTTPTVYTPAPKLAGFAVKVLLEEGHGSGVHIGHGLILTNAHVASNQKAVSLKQDDGVTQNGEVLWANEARDVALVLAEHPEQIDAAPLVCRDLVEGEPLTSYGNPTNVEFITVKGRVAGKARDLGPWKSVAPVDMTIIQGMSGGAVTDKDGNLVGLNVGVMPVYMGVSASLSGIGYVIPTSAICPLLGRV